jgi:glycosyltransferase involved in cell wall biosynthesis
VSVVVCIYNQERFVCETIESVLAQTYPNLEIILTDDGSTDDTPKLVASYAAQHPGRVQAVLSEVNTGIPGNMNRGLARCRGEFTAWLDGDDLMAPTKVARQVAFLQSHPEAVGCYHDAELLDSETGRSLGSAYQLYNRSDKMLQGEVGRWFIPRHYMIPSTFMARSRVLPPHGFDERLKYLSEVLYFFEVFHTGKLLAIPERLGAYRRHGGNVTSSAEARGRFFEYEMLVYALIEARYPEHYRLARRGRIACLMTEAFRAYRQGNLPRYRAIRRLLVAEGEYFRAGVVEIGLRAFGNRLAAATNAQPFAGRPTWLTRVSQVLLR